MSDAKCDSQTPNKVLRQEPEVASEEDMCNPEWQQQETRAELAVS